MKCPGCGYENKPDAMACNLCQAVLIVKRRGDTRGETRVLGTPSPLRHLLIRAGAPTITLEPGKAFVIGRQASCTLAIPSNRVSRVHAEIRWDGEKPVLVDKGSSNGTFVRGKPVKEHPLEPGDEVEIGPFHCVYKYDDPNNPSSGGDPMEGTQTLAGDFGLLSGRIAETGVAEVLQGLEFNTKTGTLDVYGREAHGWLCLREGLPLAAEVSGTRDDEAVLLMLTVKSGRFTFSPEVAVPDRRMKTTITHLLLEAGRRADEGAKTSETQLAPRGDGHRDPGKTMLDDTSDGE